MAVNFNSSIGVNGINGLNLGAEIPAINESEVDKAILTFNTARTEGNEEEIAAALADLQDVLGTTNVTTTNANAKSKEIKEEIEKLEKEKAANMKKMDKLEDHIEDLADKAEDYILKAAKEQEEAVKEHEEETQQVLDKQIKAYIAANKEGGEGMTRDELQENIKGAMPNVPEVAEAVAALAAASSLVDEIDSCLGKLNSLIRETELIEQNIAGKQTEFEVAEKAEKEAETKKCCDPIGFTMGEGEEKVQYDFIVDDGAFDTTSDFLGAGNQWAEMMALDTDGDSVVSSEELKAGNIKAVKTDAVGNQTVVDLAEEFGEEFSIDLNSYTEGGAHSAIDTTVDADGNGVMDQTLLGTFNLNIGGESISGYNTLDDVNFLESNYGVTSNVAEAGELETSDAFTEMSITSEDLQMHNNFFNIYTEKSEMLKTEIEQGYEELGLSKEQMSEMNEIAAKEADENARNFFATLEVENEEIEEEKEEKEELNPELAA